MELVTQNAKIAQQNEQIQLQAEELRALNESIISLNEGLEKQVEERTIALKIKNRQLAEYAFFNAHRLRSPIANIKGLTNLLDYTISMNDHEEIMNRIKLSVQDLDDIAIEIRETLEQEKREKLEVRAGR